MNVVESQRGAFDNRIQEASKLCIAVASWLCFDFQISIA